jgi:hypothetical protein
MNHPAPGYRYGGERLPAASSSVTPSRDARVHYYLGGPSGGGCWWWLAKVQPQGEGRVFDAPRRWVLSRTSHFDACGPGVLSLYAELPDGGSSPQRGG